jgi:triosephosphate isomerase (TIM)
MKQIRQPLVAGNWKMNGSLTEVRSLIEGIKRGIGSGIKAEVAVCPPFVYLALVSEHLKGTPIKLGAQNLSPQDKGAFTGEVSGLMLKDYNCKYAIVGHSERRMLFGETDALIAEKFAQALKVGLTPILCVGELLEEREAGQTEAVVNRQVQAVLERAGVRAFNRAVVAYEPVWAIGTGRTASSEQAQEIHAFIRALIAPQNHGVAKNLRILYGGSVNIANAAGLFRMADIDGGLIGSASLEANTFLAICHAAEDPGE